MYVRRILFLILVLLMTLSAFAMPGGGPLENDPGNGTGGGSCTYCSQTHCGCANAPLGYMLTFSCSCSSVECTRTCSYEPRS